VSNAKVRHRVYTGRRTAFIDDNYIASVCFLAAPMFSFTVLRETKENAMKRSRVVSLLSVLFVLCAVATTTAASSAKNFGTHLSGAEEVPPVVTNAQGQALFHYDKDAGTLRFKLGV
jgi:hypothetical protein